MTTNLKVVHESETQRQHVRLKMAGTVRIGDKVYKMSDLSSSGFSLQVAEKMNLQWRGKAQLQFPFQGYSFQMECDARIVHYSKEAGLAGFQFTNPDPKQVSFINSILNACFAGTIMAGPDILDIALRDSFTKPRVHKADAEKKGFFPLMKRVLPTLALTALGGGALLFIAGNAYEDSVLLKSYQGIVESQKIHVRAPVQGAVQLMISDAAEVVSKGQALAVMGNGGTAAPPPAPMPDSAQSSAGMIPPAGAMTSKQVTITSPCDCIIRSFNVRDGEFRGYGDTLFELVPSNTQPWISALIDPKKAHHLRLQDDVNIRIAGESGFITGYITQIAADGPALAMTRVTIMPQTQISAEMLDRPAYIEFVSY